MNQIQHDNHNIQVFSEFSVNLTAPNIYSPSVTAVLKSLDHVSNSHHNHNFHVFSEFEFSVNLTAPNRHLPSVTAVLKSLDHVSNSQK